MQKTAPQHVCVSQEKLKFVGGGGGIETNWNMSRGEAEKFSGSPPTPTPILFNGIAKSHFLASVACSDDGGCLRWHWTMSSMLLPAFSPSVSSPCQRVLGPLQWRQAVPVYGERSTESPGLHPGVRPQGSDRDLRPDLDTGGGSILAASGWWDYV